MPHLLSPQIVGGYMKSFFLPLGLMLFFCGAALGIPPIISPPPANTDPEVKNWNLCIQPLQNLKIALVNFNNDIEKFPIIFQEGPFSKGKALLVGGARSLQDSLILIGLTSLEGYNISMYPPRPPPGSYDAASPALLGTQSNVLITPCEGVTTFQLDPRVYLKRVFRSIRPVVPAESGHSSERSDEDCIIIP